MSSRAINNSNLSAIAIGRQDLYLMADPQITFFKTVYRRHTTFADENEDEYIENDDIILDEHIVSPDCSCDECQDLEFYIEI